MGLGSEELAPYLSIPLRHSPRLCHAPSTFFHIWRNRHSPWAQKEQETPRDPSSWSRLCWRHCSSCLDNGESRIPSSQCWVCLKCSWPSSQWRKDKGTSSQHGPNKQHQDKERGYTGECSSFQVPWIIYMHQTHSSVLNQGKHRRGRHVINWKKSGNQI